MIPLGGLTCCLGGAVLYFLSKKSGRFFEILSSVTRVHQLKDLEQLLEVESKLVAVSGSVGSETPIKCERSDIHCVFSFETARQLFLKRYWSSFWVEDSTMMQPVTKEVPWYLDDGTDRVSAAGALESICFALRVGSNVFEKSEPSSDCLEGLKMLGVRRIEYVLPIGTPLTVVGEVVKDGIGNFRIQESEKVPFVFSPIPLDQIISTLGKWSRRFKYASVGLTAVGVVLISKPVIEYILERRRRRLLLKRVADEAAKKAELVTRGLETQYENSSVSTSRDGNVLDLCVICLKRKYDAAFVRCGHMCCITCSLLVMTCPLCRRPVEQVLKIYRL